VATQDPPRSGLVLLLIIINLVIKPKSMIPIKSIIADLSSVSIQHAVICIVRECVVNLITIPVYEFFRARKGQCGFSTDEVSLLLKNLTILFGPHPGVSIISLTFFQKVFRRYRLFF